MSIPSAVGDTLNMVLGRKRMANLSRERYVHEQALLLELSSQLLKRSELDEIMGYLVEEVIRLFEVDACALLLPDEQPGHLIFRASAGWHSDPVVEHRRVLSNDRSSSGQVMRTQVPVLSRSSAERGHIPAMTIDWLEDEEFEGLAIVPLIVDEQSVGALALTMRTPRQLDEDEIRFLQILANQAGLAIVYARLHKEELRLQRLEEELAVGRNIQRSLLPSAPVTADGWQISNVYLPARQVGGDLYDHFELPVGEDRVGLVIGDVAGKGVPAALFMATSRTLIRSTALAGLTPASTLAEANRLILQDSPTELFLSAFYGILNTSDGRLTYANAGHNPPLWFRKAEGDFQELAARGIVLCVIDNVSLEEKSIEIASGDILVLYTDGVTEAVDADTEEFGVERLQQVVASNRRKGASEILEAIVEAVTTFIGDVEQPDDLTLMVIKRL